MPLIHRLHIKQSLLKRSHRLLWTGLRHRALSEGNGRERPEDPLFEQPQRGCEFGASSERECTEGARGRKP